MFLLCEQGQHVATGSSGCCVCMKFTVGTEQVGSFYSLNVFVINDGIN